MADIGIPELLIILAIVIILFGPARIGGIGKSLGDAIRGFRQAVKDGDEGSATSEAPAPPAATIINTPPALAESTGTQEYTAIGAQGGEGRT